MLPVLHIFQMQELKWQTAKSEVKVTIHYLEDVTRLFFNSFLLTIMK